MSARHTAANPFVGLRPFKSEDSLYYFGRSEHIKALLRQLQRTRFLAVVGSSGAGKSSLVRAGLIPNLEAGFLVQDRDRWQIAEMKPGDDPLRHLAAALLQALNETLDVTSVEAFCEQIRRRGAQAVLEKAIIHDRSVVMAYRLQAYLRRGGAFVAVGALHLYGPKGMLALLAEDGWVVRPVALQGP